MVSAAPLGLLVCCAGAAMAVHLEDTYRNDYAVGPGGWLSAPLADVEDKPCNIPRIRLTDGVLANEAATRTFRSSFLGGKSPVIFEVLGGRDAGLKPRSHDHKACQDNPGLCPPIDVSPQLPPKDTTGSREWLERLARVLTKDRLLKEYSDYPAVVVPSGSRKSKDFRLVELVDIMNATAFKHEWAPDPAPEDGKPVPPWRSQSTRGADETMYMWGPKTLQGMHKLQREINPVPPSVRNLHKDNDTCAFGGLSIGHQGSGLAWHYTHSTMNLVVHGATEWLLTSKYPPGGFNRDSPSRVWFRDVWPNVTKEEREGLHMCTLGPGDLMYVPAGFYHTTRNHGQTVALAMACSGMTEGEADHQVPRFYPDTGEPAPFSNRFQVNEKMIAEATKSAKSAKSAKRAQGGKEDSEDGKEDSEEEEDDYIEEEEDDYIEEEEDADADEDKDEDEDVDANEGAGEAKNGTFSFDLMEKAIRTFPDDAGFLEMLGEAYVTAGTSTASASMEEGRKYFEKAIPLFEKCVEMNPLSGKCHHQLSLCFAAVGRTEDSIAAGNTALSMERNDAFMCKGVVRSLNSLGRNRASATKLKECIDRSKAVVERGREIPFIGAVEPKYNTQVVNSALKDLANFLLTRDNGNDTEATVFGQQYIPEGQNRQMRGTDVTNAADIWRRRITIFGPARGIEPWKFTKDDKRGALGCDWPIEKRCEEALKKIPRA